MHAVRAPEPGLRPYTLQAVVFHVLLPGIMGERRIFPVVGILPRQCNQISSRHRCFCLGPFNLGSIRNRNGLALCDKMRWFITVRVASDVRHGKNTPRACSVVYNCIRPITSISPSSQLGRSRRIGAQYCHGAMMYTVCVMAPRIYTRHKFAACGVRCPTLFRLCQSNQRQDLVTFPST